MREPNSAYHTERLTKIRNQASYPNNNQPRINTETQIIIHNKLQSKIWRHSQKLLIFFKMLYKIDLHLRKIFRNRLILDFVGIVLTSLKWKTTGSNPTGFLVGFRNPTLSWGPWKPTMKIVKVHGGTSCQWVWFLVIGSGLVFG